MKDNIPKLLKDSIEKNTVDINIITKNLKLPWLKLDIEISLPSEDQLQNFVSNKDWRKQWNYPEPQKDSYQVKGWNGDVFFGPTDWSRFLSLTDKNNNNHDQDEDSKCRAQRQNLKYDWYVDKNHWLRKEISKIFPDDDDLNLVNTYSLPPGGYVFPHRDYAGDGMGLAKIYIALKWSQDNVFGMYGCGNMPVRQGDVFLLNNYTLPHWVYNGSADNRIVVDISANLHSPIIKDKIIESFKKTFAC